MLFINIVTIIIYLILFAWVWSNLNKMESIKKVIFLIVSIAIMFLITLTIFQISQSQVYYENIEIKNSIRNTLVTIFTGINSLIIIPTSAKMYEKWSTGELEQKVIIKRIAVIVIILLICLWIEFGYMKDTQQGILQVYQNLKNT